MRRPVTIVLLSLLIVAQAAATPAQARTGARERAARAAVVRVAAVARNVRVDAEVRAHLRRSARSVHGRRRACAAVGAVLEARLAARELTSARRRRLLKAVRGAERTLRRLRTTRACAPRVHRTRVKEITPRFDPQAPEFLGTHEQGDEEEEFRIRRDRRSRPLPPQGEPSDVGLATAANVNDPLQIFASTDVGALGMCCYPHEPQVAKAGGVVLYSGNTNGAVSFDAGAMFQALNPAQVFGNDQPLCCDTVVRYAPSIDRFLWLMQYWCPPATVGGQQTANCTQTPSQNNRYRLAVISPATLLANRANPARGWRVFEFTPRGFGSGTWFDYPDMSVGADQLYMTWDEVGLGALNVRLPLRDLTRAPDASGRGSARTSWFRAPALFLRVAQNAGSVGLYLRNDTDSRDMVYVWPDPLPFPIALGLPHATRPQESYSSLSPTGQNWNDRAGSPIVKGAALSGDRLWVAWAAGRSYPRSSVSWPQPHIQLATYDTGDLLHALFSGELRNVSNRYIWSHTVTYTDPTLATNAEGDVAISFTAGSLNTMPSPYVGVLTNRQETLRARLSQGPAGVAVGDYAGLQPDGDDPTRWVAADTFTAAGPGPGIFVHWLYTSFGRAPAPPPPPPPPVQRTATAISIISVKGTAFDCCFYGDVYNTTGELTGAPPGSAVRLDYTSPDAAAFSNDVTTDGSGLFVDKWTSPTLAKATTWTITAHYAGDATHLPSDSDPFFQLVQPAPG